MIAFRKLARVSVVISERGVRVENLASKEVTLDIPIHL